MKTADSSSTLAITLMHSTYSLSIDLHPWLDRAEQLVQTVESSSGILYQYYVAQYDCEIVPSSGVAMYAIPDCILYRQNIAVDSNIMKIE